MDEGGGWTRVVDGRGWWMDEGGGWMRVVDG